MPIQAGDDFSWYKPVDSDNSETIGSFVGDHEALNITGAQPDYHYYYQRFSKGRSDAVIRFLNRGWSVVGPDDPEKFGTDRVSWKVQTSLGTERAYQDVLLMKIPLSLYREQQEARQDREKSLVADHGSRFTELGEERASQLRHRPKGQLYYMGRDHGQSIEDI